LVADENRHRADDDAGPGRPAITFVRVVQLIPTVSVAR
jgi:hypothetical protein